MFALVRRDSLVHPIAMTHETRGGGGSAFTAVRSTGPANQAASRPVRLSHLRKLRECDQVAAVCYRLRGEDIEFLLVQTRGSGRWTFPKGSAERGLSHAQAAALEAFEEAGVHGRIEEESFARYVCRKRASRKVSLQSQVERFTVNAYLCQVKRLSKPKEADRNRTWFSVEEAAKRLGEGRNDSDGEMFAGVIEKAVARVRLLRNTAVGESKRWHFDLQRDGLRKVLFEANEQLPGGQVFSSRQIHRQRVESTQGVVVQERKLLSGEVLQFSSKKKKVHSLGSGFTRV